MGFERRTSMLDTRSLSCNGWAACTAKLHSWWTDHHSCSGEFPTLPFSEPHSLSPDRYHATRSAVFRGSPLDIGRCRPNGLASWRAVMIGVSGCTYWPWRSASRCSSRSRWQCSILPATAIGRRDMTPRVDEQRWLAGHDYDGGVVRVESQLDMVGWSRHFVDIQT